MPIIDTQDARDLDSHLQSFFDSTPAERPYRLRQLFTEKFDFNPATGKVSLAKAPQNVTLPSDAERIATIEGINVVYVPIEIPGTTRVRKSEAATAARLIAGQIGDDMLLLISNQQAEGEISQLHVILPTFAGSTPALRRMVIERYLPRRTTIQQLSNIYHEWQKKGDLRLALEEAFNVEAVTRAFFQQYHKVFMRVQELVRGFPRTEEGLEAEKLFVQTLFNRLMFIYFLSRKGWLKFEDSLDYLASLWKDYQKDKDAENFYKNRLEVLFFEGLNNETSRDVRSPMLASLIGDPPFLNGGLFDKTADEIKRSDVAVPDEAIDLILHELFEHYNFTVTESTPLDQEVAVDPEMLGKVFEELVTGRHESGSFYTPRPVVSFMCREALKGYLQEKASGLPAEAIEIFIDQHDVSGLNFTSAEVVRKALTEIKVVDPACGSGAYLLGMMHELVELETVLYNEKLIMDTKSLYDLKLRIIEENVYGADIDQFAVNIAMLRLWLSLAIDYESYPPPPLPNLDFKIVCGDSLTAPDPNPSEQNPQYEMFSEQVRKVSERLAFLKHQYLMPGDANKRQLFDEIENEMANLKTALVFSPAPEDAVDWRVNFSEVFSENGGFDVAIANPPYVRNEEIGTIKDTIRGLYPAATTGRSDLFCYFYARGVQLLTPRGMHVFVCSNAWLDAVYGVTLIQWLSRRTTIDSIYESEVERQFTTAGINTIISVIRNGLPEDLTGSALFVTLLEPFTETTTGLGLKRAMLGSPAIRITQRYHSDLVSEANRFSQLEASPKWGGRFLRAPEPYNRIYQALEKSGKILDDLVRGERYLNTGGADGFFILTEVEELDAETCRIQVTSKEGQEFSYPKFVIESQFLKPGLKSTDSDSLIVRSPDCWVLSIPPDTSISDYRVKDYIKWGEKATFDTRSVTCTQTPWWKPPLQAQYGAKLLWGRTHADSHRVFLNPELLISLRFFRLHPLEDSLTKPIWALLNSTVYALLKEIHGRRNLGYGALETGLVDILPLPVPDIGSSFADDLTIAIESIAKRPVGPLEAEIKTCDRRALDELIVQAVGLPTNFVEEMYDSALDMLTKRSSKAQSISKS